jgi:hypothetical protein
MINLKEKYQKHISESTRFGPRQFEVPYVLNNLVDGPTIEIGGNSSLFKWTLVRRGWPFTLIDPMNPAFNNGKNHRLATCIHGDIRKLSPSQTGRFPNVLLVSVLEHIGLSAYGQTKDWKSSPREEQRKAFEHCLTFIAPGGRIIVTLPHSNKEEEQDPKFSLRYNNKMLRDLQAGHKLIDQRFYRLAKPGFLDRWEEVPVNKTIGHRSNVCFILEL